MHAKAEEGTQRHTNARECARQHTSSNIEVVLEHGEKLLGLAVVEWVRDVKHGVVLVHLPCHEASRLGELLRELPHLGARLQQVDLVVRLVRLVANHRVDGDLLGSCVGIRGA